MAFFRSYFDESGKFKDQRVISFCGVVASRENLDRFNEAWDALLRKNQLSQLHTTNALCARRSLSPVIRSESAKERCESLKPFVDCIVENLELGIAIAIDVEGYSKWSPGAKKRVGGSDDPAYLAFLRTSLVLKEYACREDDHISIMCDDDQDTALNFYQLYRHFKKTDLVLRKKFVSLSFSDDSRYPALQAADLIAGLIRLDALRRFGYHPHDFKILVDYLMREDKSRKLNWQICFADKSTMDNLGPRLG